MMTQTTVKYLKNCIVGAKDEFDRIFANRKNVVDFNAMDKDDEE